MNVRISQIELVSAISRELERQGIKSGNSRQYNALIAAANSIIREFEKQHVMATPGMGMQAWLQSDDTGLSSMFMAYVIGRCHLGMHVNASANRNHHPLDPDDFGRCVRLLDAVPELREHLDLMRGKSRQWRALINKWDELESLYREESPSGRAPKLYERMKTLLEGEE